jgi:UDP-N-acetylglucosamine acyltransferase
LFGFSNPSELYMGIHPSSIIEPGARVHASAEIGPFCVVGPKVTIGKHTVLVAHVSVTGQTRLGARNLIGPSAVIGGAPQDLSYGGEASEVFVGDDNVIGVGVTINGGTRKGGLRTVVGHRNRIGSRGHVAHDCLVENDCTVGVGCLLAGHVRVESGASVGALSAVHHFATVGRLAWVGVAGAISRDAPPFMRIEGYGSVVGVNAACLAKSGIPPELIENLRQVFRTVWREGRPKPEALSIVEHQWGEIPLVLELVEFLRASDLGRMGRRRDHPFRPLDRKKS